MSGFKLAVDIALVAFSAVMIIVVLVQQTKSAGLGGGIGADTQSFTTRGKAARTEAKLQKLTVALGIVIGVLALVTMVVSNFL